MPTSEEVVLDFSGGGEGRVQLKVFTVQKWRDVSADLERLFPDLQRDGGAAKGFRYRGAFDREKVVNDDESLGKFFSHAVEEQELTQAVVLVATASKLQAHSAQQPQAAAGRPVQVPVPSAAPAEKPVVRASVIQFPPSTTGDAMLQVRPVVLWGKDQLTVSVFLSCSQLPAPSDAPSQFIFSYSKARPGTNDVDIGLSSPGALRIHLKGDLVETGASLRQDVWQHLVLCWSSREGALTLFIDGNKAFSATKLRAGTRLEQGGAFRLGNFEGGSGQAFIGCMAEVSVWKGVVEREAIRSMSQKPLLKGSEDKLCLYFNFKGTSEDDSSLVVDVSSDIEGQLCGGAALVKNPVAICGGAGAADGGGASAAAQGSGASFASRLLRFEERSFGRVLTAPPPHVVSTELTLAVWVCSVDTMQSGTIVSWLCAPSDAPEYRVELANCANLRVTIGPDAAALDTKLAVNDGRWHFLVVTWTSKGGTLILYVDGSERFTRSGVSEGLRLDEGLAGSGAASAGSLAVGQRLLDLGKRGIRDLSQAYFGLVAHLSVWRAALSGAVARNLMAGPLEGSEKDLALYLNPDKIEFASRLVADAAQARQGRKLQWQVLGAVDLIEAGRIGMAHPSAAAAPLLDRQIVSASVALQGKSAGRLALQPLDLAPPPRDGASGGAGGGGAELSICVWVMAAGGQGPAGVGGQCVLSYSSGPNEAGEAVGLVLRDTSNLTLHINGQQVKTGCRLQADVWHHLALTWRSADGACCLYLDCRRAWEGKIGKDAEVWGPHASLWVGKQHAWQALNKAAEAGVPRRLLCSLLYCGNKGEAASRLAAPDALDHLAALRQAAGSSLPVFKGGDAALAGALHDWLCRASCHVETGLVGQVSLLCVWRRVLAASDVAFVSSGALLGNEKGLVACLDMDRYSADDCSIGDRFSDEVAGAVVGGARLVARQQLRAGVEWVPPQAPGTTPKAPGDMCALLLDKAPGGLPSYLLLPDLTLASGGAGSSEGATCLTISVWVRTCDAEPAATLLSFAAASSLTEVWLGNPGALEVLIAGNRVATGAAVNDGHWHHLAVTWTSSLPIKDQQPQPQQQQQGELALYLDGRLAHRSPGKTKTGAAQVSAAAGSLAVGARQEAQGYGACWQGAVASLAILGRRLDAKAVAALFAAPLLRGSEEHLRVYFDFDFEAPEGTSSFIREGGEVMNRGRGRGSGGGAAGVLHGAARLVLLSNEFQVRKARCAAEAGPAAAAALDKERGAFDAKCLAFKDKKAEACAYMMPVDDMPDTALTLALWLRSCDLASTAGRSGAGRADGGAVAGPGKLPPGHGCLVSYAAYCRKAFNLRVSHKGSDGKEAAHLLRVDGATLFGQVLAKLSKQFGQAVTFRHTLAPGQLQPSTVSSEADFDAFCELVRKAQEQEQATAAETAGAGSAGGNQRLKAVAVSTAPFKEGSKLASAEPDPEKLAQMRQMEELCVECPADLQVVVKGQRCKGQVPIDINDGRWHHLALTWSSKTGLLVLYVDGNARLKQGGFQQGARLATGGCLALGQAQASIGTAVHAGRGFQGEVAQVALWAKALPSSRVLRAMAAPLNAAQDGLRLLWNFSDDPLSGSAKISNAALPSSGTAEIRDKSGLAWLDAALPGDARECGLGRSANKSDIISVHVKCCSLSAAMLGDSRLKAIFLHVVVGQVGDDAEHALRHGGFPVPKALYKDLEHEQVVHVDAIGHGAQRCAVQALVCKGAGGGHVEALLQVRLCSEAVAKSGEVSAQVVALAQMDLLEYLEAGRDEKDKELRLWPAGARGSQDEPAATVLVSFQAVAALRALQAAGKTNKSSARPDSGEPPLQDLPAFERRKSNFSLSGSTRNLFEERGEPRDAPAPALADAVPAHVASEAPVASTPVPEAKDPAPSTQAPAPAASSAAPVAAAQHSKHASKKKAHKDDDMDLPERVILHCTFSSGQTSSIAVDLELNWPQVQKVLEKDLGPARCIEFTDARSNKKCRVDQPKMWERLRMQVEDDFDRQSGDAHVEVKVVLAADADEDEQGAKQAVAAGVRSKGSNAQDNPDDYDFLFECSQLGAGPWAQDGQPFRITVKPDIAWTDFRELVTSKFGADVIMSYRSTKGKLLPLRTEDHFNAACDQIEDEWDDADGDGSLHCVAQPPKGGMPVVKGRGEVMVRLAAGEERLALQAQVANLAPLLQGQMAHVCAALRLQERKAPTWYPTPLAAAGVADPAAAAVTASMSGTGAEQALKTLYSKALIAQEDEAPRLLAALEKLVPDDDVLLSLGHLPSLVKAGKSASDAAHVFSQADARPLEASARLVDWASFLSRFRLATAHEAAVVAELPDVLVRTALVRVYLCRQQLRQATGAPAQGQLLSWASCGEILKKACSLSDEQCSRLTSWAQSRAGFATASSAAAIGARPAVGDVLSLAEEAELVDVGSLLHQSLDDDAVLRVLKKRPAVEEALGAARQQSAGGDRGVAAHLKVGDAVPLVSAAAGLSLAASRRLLQRTATVSLLPKGVCETAEGAPAPAAQEVVLHGWLDKLWILHEGEMEALARVRHARRQAIRRALVSSCFSDDSVVKAIRQRAAPQPSAARAAGNQAKSGQNGGIVGIKEAIAAACEREGVVCSLQEAQALCDEVPLVGGRRDVAEYVESLRLVDVVEGSLDACCPDLCPKINAFLDACAKLDSTDPSRTLLLPSQIVQALLSVGVPISTADTVAQECSGHSEELVDYRDMVCGRLLVLSERERERLATPMAAHQRKTREARRRLLERQAQVMAALALHDSLGRAFIDEAQAVTVLQEMLQLPQADCQELLDIAAPRVAGVPAAAGDAAAPRRRIDYSLLAGFRVVAARPAVAAFCWWGCAGCAGAAESFLDRQAAVMTALHQRAARWRKTPEGLAVERIWGVGLLPFHDFETTLRAELCAVSEGGRWDARHVRSLASAQGVLAVNLNSSHSDVSTGDPGKKDVGGSGKIEAGGAARGSTYSCHLVRIEHLRERFAVLEAADARALRRLTSLPHQRALGAAHGALARHRARAATASSSLDWSVVQGSNTPSALLLAFGSSLPPAGAAPATSDDEEEGLPCGDHQALADIWRAGSSLESLMDSLVPIYCHMLPATPVPLAPGKLVGARSEQRKASAAAPAAGSTAGTSQAQAPQQYGLTRGQQVFRKLLASRRPGVMQILQAMGAMTPTCVPSPLSDATKRYVVATSSYQLASLDSAFFRSLQLKFVEAKGVPDPGDRYEPKTRMLKLSLFDAYMMKFVGNSMSIELNMPKDDKAHSRQAWVPTKAAPSVFVSADLKTHAQMYLYFELNQTSQRKSDTSGKEILDVSCAHALLALKDVPNGTTGGKELAVSGGTPFMPRQITPDLIDGGKKSGLLARLRQSTHKSLLSLKFEKVDKQTQEMVKSKRLPPNTLCVSDAALPIAQYHTLSAQVQARSKSPQKGGRAAAGVDALPPALEDLFTRAQVDQDPVLALFPKMRESPHMMAHLSAAWAFRYNRLSTKDKANNAVLQTLLRECTLIVWPLMKMRAIKEASSKDALVRQEAADKYIQAANKAKSLGEMYSVISGDAASSTVVHQPFRIEELLD